MSNEIINGVPICGTYTTLVSEFATLLFGKSPCKENLIPKISYAPSSLTLQTRKN